jgi:hypothetical protein
MPTPPISLKSRNVDGRVVAGKPEYNSQIADK